MKKLVLVTALFLLAQFCPARNASADLKDWLSKVPSNRTGIAYNISDSEIDWLTTFEVVKHKGFSGEIGYSNDNDKLVAVASYELLRLKDKIELPILEYVVFRPGIWAGFENINIGKGSDGNNDFSWGFSLTALEVKF